MNDERKITREHQRKSGSHEPLFEFDRKSERNDMERHENDRTRSERNFGIDCLRAAAIGLVLASHFANGLHFMGVCGVELFFVISGFLIGGILLKTIDTNGGFGLRDLEEFLRRRWYRTLPNYYLFLFIYFAYQHQAISSYMIHGGGLARYALFLQNFAWPNPNWSFGHSWSLCVEEWFYALTAASLFLLFRLLPPSPRRSTYAIGVTMGLFLVGSPALRVAFRNDFDDFRTVVVFRLDAIMYGVLIAVVKSRMPTIWNRRAGQLGIGVTSIAAAVAIYGKSPLATAAALSLLPLGLAALVPAFSTLARPVNLVASCVERISLWSYSIYLSHTIIYLGLMPQVMYHALSWWQKLGYKAVAIGLTIAVSAATYRFFEKPMTDLRTRHGRQAFAGRGCAASER